MYVVKVDTCTCILYIFVYIIDNIKVIICSTSLNIILIQRIIFSNQGAVCGIYELLFLNIRSPKKFIMFLLSDTKKDDTFGADDKDWDVYKEIVSVDVICESHKNMVIVSYHTT